jgi:hypothetical protein
VIDASAFQMLLMVLTGWLARREREVVAYVIEEKPVPAPPAGRPASAPD